MSAHVGVRYAPARARARRHVPVAILATVVAGVAAALAAGAWSGQVGGPSAGPVDAGPVTELLLPVARVGALLLAVGTIGLITLRIVVLAPDPPSWLAPAARRWACAWAVGLAAWSALTVSDLSGVPVWSVPQRISQWSVLLSADLVRAQVASFVLVCAVAAVMTSTSAAVLRAAAVLACAAVVLPLLTIHAGHEVRAVPLVAVSVHAIAATVWTGTLLAVLAQLRGHQVITVRAVPRLSALSLVCATVVLLSGFTTAVAAQVSLADLDTAYGRLLMAKGLLLVLVVAAGALHRRVSVPAALAGSTRALLRLGVAELALLGTTFGVASALSATAPPWS